MRDDLVIPVEVLGSLAEFCLSVVTSSWLVVAWVVSIRVSSLGAASWLGTSADFTRVFSAGSFVSTSSASSTDVVSSVTLSIPSPTSSLVITSTLGILKFPFSS